MLVGAEIEYTREAEGFPYASKTYRPDFVIPSLDLVIEIKLCPDDSREKDMIAEINDDILAYSIRYKNIVFAIYDLGFIRDVDKFVGDFERHRGITVIVVKH